MAAKAGKTLQSQAHIGVDADRVAGDNSSSSNSDSRKGNLLPAITFGLG
jgi:hypothetical protein